MAHRKLLLLALLMVISLSFAQDTLVSVDSLLISNGTIINCTLQEPKSRKIAFILSVIPFTGIFGVDRFYMKYIGLGVFKIIVTTFTCGIGGVVWYFIDFIAILLNIIKLDGDECALLNDLPINLKLY
jgi:TM2 domain-containing membrane protein YozV